MTTAPAPAAPLRPADYVGRGMYFLLLFLAILVYPMFPLTELDSSWRQVLNLAFVEGWQFGKDIVFTYGPLGWMMSNTYSGVFFWPFVVWQVISSAIFATLIFRQGLRLGLYPRAFFFSVMTVFCVSYPDALHMIIIALVGFELVRDAGGAYRRWTAATLLLLAVMAAIKFTNLLLSGFVVLVAAGLEFSLRRPRAALRLIAWFGGSFLLVWLACRQNPLNFPAYVYHSLQISSGYEHTMGLPTSAYALKVGLPVLAILIGYALLHLALAAEKARAAARCLVLGAFIYINWKHGFVRADGHLIGFHFCALVVITGFPALLDDPPRLRWARWALLLPAFGFCLAGLQNPLPLTRNFLSLFQDKIYWTGRNSFRLGYFYSQHREKLRQLRTEWDLPRTRALIGDATIDYVSYTTAILLYNRFNYHPRPVIQSYSAYTPVLARLNARFLASDAAPEYILFRLETIDGRYPSLDDSHLLHLLMHRYDFVHTEKGLQLWRRKPGGFDAAAYAPQPLRTAPLPVGETVDLSEHAGRRLWATIDLPPTFLGRLRNFFYKPPIVQMRVTDHRGLVQDYRLPLPEARAGFMLSPIIDDVFGFMRFASELPPRSVKSIQLLVAEADRKYLAPAATFELAELPASDAGSAYLTQAAREQFFMFQAVPLAFEAQAPPSAAEIDGEKVMVMHAPSEMVFSPPTGARRLTGRFGMLPGTWSDGGSTNGAEFTVYWSNGAERIELMRRYLSPVSEPADRGLQKFDVTLPERTDGRIFLNVTAGAENNFSWDWTAWTDIAFQ